MQVFSFLKRASSFRKVLAIAGAACLMLVLNVQEGTAQNMRSITQQPVDTKTAFDGKQLLSKDDAFNALMDVVEALRPTHATASADGKILIELRSAFFMAAATSIEAGTPVDIAIYREYKNTLLPMGANYPTVATAARMKTMFNDAVNTVSF